MKIILPDYEKHNKHQHVNLFKLARKGDLEQLKKVINEIADYHRLEKIQKYDNKIVVDSAICGQLNVLEYLIKEQNFDILIVYKRINTIISNNHIHILKWLEKEYDYKINIGSVMWANSLEMVKYILNNKNTLMFNKDYIIRKLLYNYIIFRKFKLLKYLVETYKPNLSQTTTQENILTYAKRFSNNKSKIYEYLKEYNDKFIKGEIK